MFRWIERAGELELELESESEDGVFIDALEAVRELLLSPSADGLAATVEGSCGSPRASCGRSATTGCRTSRPRSRTACTHESCWRLRTLPKRAPDRGRARREMRRS